MESFDSEDFYATMEREALEAMASSTEQQKENTSNSTNVALSKPNISLDDQAEADMYEEMERQAIEVFKAHELFKANQEQLPPQPPPNQEDQLQQHSVDTEETKTPFSLLSHSNKRSAVTTNDTLFDVFGFTAFRDGQDEVIQAALRGVDTAVFWATGLGKSICYQIPALHSGRPVFVISPLISLMQDQCTKLNSICGRRVATFLGSAQNDYDAEGRAMRGEHLLVYLTPEKATQDGFLDSLARLHHASGISLIAVDEAHCLSEWGHDFRPSYRHLGRIRAHAGLKGVPLMALTATAVPRVQKDIIVQMGLQNAQIATSSFDRTNLQISIKRKPSGGARVALHDIIEKLRANSADNSTIIYCPTKNAVDEITALLLASLHGVCKVAAYHAGLSQADREDGHNGFLTGQIAIIVATVAFGMGIDKPDTRRVIHWGSPKTVEEYYQQIGRAGRDGLPAECTMFADMHDFARYQDDFYMKNLEGNAKSAVLASLEALRKLSFDEVQCRRVSILKFFHEKPAFGNRCGTCDNCKNAEVHKGDTTRDFGPVVRVLLQALSHLKPCATSILEKVISGGTVDDWRYLRGAAGVEPAKTAILSAKKAPGANVLTNPCKDLLPLLITAGHITQISRKNMGGRSYTEYAMAPSGRYLQQHGGECVLPVPSSVREAEQEAERKHREAMLKLQAAGVDISSLPPEEQRLGKGEVIDAYTHFHAAVENARSYSPAKADAMLQLKERISTWRLEVAARQRMAPAAVLAEHLVVKIAYIASRGPLSSDALKAAGVRAAPVQELEALVCAWCSQHQIGLEAVTSSGGSSFPMIGLPTAFRATVPWAHAAYIPNKPWEASAERFSKGEALAAIAINQGVTKTGKSKVPILPTTVAGHILDAIPFARHSIDLARLAIDYSPPNSIEWTLMQQAEREQNLDVTLADTDKNSILCHICPSYIVTYAEKTEEEKADSQSWRRLCSWYCALRRVGFEPTFRSSVARVLPKSLAPPSGRAVAEQGFEQMGAKRQRYE